MSVIKAKRSQSSFEVFTNAAALRKELTQYVMRDFAYDGKLEQMQQFILNDERTEILHDCRNMCSCITMANNIYVTCLEEYEERRKYQDLAIGYCARIKQELQFIVDAFPHKININKYAMSIKLADKEIVLIKAWRKADKKLKEKLG